MVGARAPLPHEDDVFLTTLPNAAGDVPAVVYRRTDETAYLHLRVRAAHRT